MLDSLFDGPLVRAGLGAQPGGGIRQPNAAPLGARTGAPVRTVVRVIQIPAAGALPVLVVEGTPENRVVTLIGPNAAFTIFVGDSGVDVTKGLGLPANSPQDFVLPGYQELYAVTDAPVFVNLRVQIAPILIGDTERK